jgi:hypothetical protein
MVYNTQNYWVFENCPLSGILKTERTAEILGFRTFSIVRIFPK